MITNQASKKVKFGPVDGSAAFPLLFLLLSPSFFMLMVLLSFTGLILILEYYGLKLDAIFRLIRSFFSGKNRKIRPYSRKNINL